MFNQSLVLGAKLCERGRHAPLAASRSPNRRRSKAFTSGEALIEMITQRHYGFLAKDMFLFSDFVECLLSTCADNIVSPYLHFLYNKLHFDLKERDFEK